MSDVVDQTPTLIAIVRDVVRLQLDALSQHGRLSALADLHEAGEDGALDEVVNVIAGNVVQAILVDPETPDDAVIVDLEWCLSIERHLDGGGRCSVGAARAMIDTIRMLYAWLPTLTTKES